MEATVGAVLYSPTGSFAAAFSMRLPDCSSPLLAKAMACKEALSWVRNRGVLSVVLHTDCSDLQRLLASSRVHLFSYIAYPIDSARSLMSLFNSCSVELIPRTANLGAHTLATLAFSQVNAMCWDSVPPAVISDFI
ncbi:uncharacterized protein LOC116001383 [Ipomoea triloba]|uniref:uncharacterized protein LOC116001383 n=1 Tax=Ipomoea triloba TaxID=35885 RepID=UPI00125E76DD|nr:uncharacterized protein LOC116001383 [Ipomoea triloba]